MTIHRIRSEVLAQRGDRFESASRSRALARLAEVQKIDPQAKLVTIPAGQR